MGEPEKTESAPFKATTAADMQARCNAQAAQAEADRKAEADAKKK